MDLVYETVYSFLPIGLCLSLLLFIAISVFRIKPPTAKEVREVLGDDPHLESDSQNTRGSNVIKVVAHRGAGLDAPENTIEAFRMVR